MINDQLDFVTPRPAWATRTTNDGVEDATGARLCTHTRDFSVGPVGLWIAQEDRLVDGNTVYGRPQLVIAGDDDQTQVTPQLLARLAQQALAAAEAYARITR